MKVKVYIDGLIRQTNKSRGSLVGIHPTPQILIKRLRFWAETLQITLKSPRILVSGGFSRDRAKTRARATGML